MSWLTLTPTALFRRHRAPVFLPPRVWPKKVWQQCACLSHKLRKCCDECPGDDTCEHAKVCMCGDYMDAHGIDDGHSPVSMHDYYCHQDNL